MGRTNTEEKELKDSLKKFILWFEDPYPKRAVVRPNKPHKTREFLKAVWHGIIEILHEIWLGCKELWSILS